MPETVSFADVRNLIEDRQFTFLVSENSSVLQLLYEFDARGRKLLTSTLAYYGNRDSLDESTLDDIMYERFLTAVGDIEDSRTAGSAEQRDALATEMMGIAEAPAPWLRLDYAPLDETSHVHAKCHIHIGGLQKTRIASTRVPSPRQFVEFALALFHPEAYRDHRVEGKAEADVLSALRPTNDMTTFCEGPSAALEIVAAVRFPA